MGTMSTRSLSDYWSSNLKLCPELDICSLFYQYSDRNTTIYIVITMLQMYDYCEFKWYAQNSIQKQLKVQFQTNYLVYHDLGQRQTINIL